MNNSQLLKLLYTNRELIQRNNLHAVDHLQMLKNDYAHATDEEVILHLELNTSLAELHFQSHHTNAIENSLRVISKFKDTEHKNILARHYWLIGHCYANKGEYESAKKHLLLALLNVTADKLTFLVHNKKHQHNRDAAGGIGLANVQRRLELLYPGKYLLNIQDKADTYSSELSLVL